MNKLDNEIKGYCIQEGNPTPENPVEIKTLKLLLFKNEIPSYKSADEMFEELGYKIIEETGYGKESPYRIKYKKDDDNVYIFYKRYKTYSKMGEWDGMCGDVSMEELKAINEKVKELGWYE